MEENRNNRENENKQDSIQPDRETLHKTDPQEKMKGPVSSSIENAGKAFETGETKEEADRKKDKNL